MSDDSLHAFSWIESETSENDKRSLIRLRDLVGSEGPFAYLEIGSHLGGSLQPFVTDQRCTAIISIDSRPASQPDNRLPEGEEWPYEDNSTERMLTRLAKIPGADLGKITTIEASTENIDSAAITHEPALCFIDGEHTDTAALRDATFCASVAPRAIIAFHDSDVVRDAIRSFVTATGGTGHQLPDLVFAVDLAGHRRLASLHRRPWLWRTANALGIRHRSQR
jgi:hypothetical protein